MSDLLLEFLYSRITPELLTLYLRASAIIEFFEKDDQLDLLDDYLVDLDDQDQLQTLDIIYQTIDSVLSNIIREYGLKLTSETHLEQHIIIIESLLYLEDHEDKQSINDIISSNDNKLEALYLLLNFASTTSVDDFSLWISDFNEAILSRLITETEDRNFRDEETIKRVKELKKLKDRPEYQKTFIYSLIKNGLTLSLPLEKYFSLFKASLIEDHINEESLARNLHLLTIICNDKGNVIDELNAILEKELSDLSIIAKVVSLVKQYSIGH